ncbi:MAG TPA: PmoA family protein [Candidatus Hydrogenedentes bacterium]|nr:PmoA family protein [Candidatus Hydrogenedentota bacterium]
MNIRKWAWVPLILCAQGHAETYALEKILIYRHEAPDLRKPYVQQLFSPSGINVLRDNVPDHIHHHGLMFAVAVDGVDFWAETPANGREESTKFTGGNPIEQRIEWRKPASGEAMAIERRTLAGTRAGNPTATLVTWRSTLAPPEGKDQITLTGSHYFGLGMRFPPSMDNTAVFSNAENAKGEIVRGDERNFTAAWCACLGAVDGNPVTVAMFSHPANIRPATWFTMAKPFAYLSATLNLHKEPLTVGVDKPLRLCYGVAVWDGAVSRETIAERYAEWIAQPE